MVLRTTRSHAIARLTTLMRSQARRSHASMWSHDNRDLRSGALEAVIGRKSGGRERRVGRWSVWGVGA
jgi:hypothetical protein